MLACVCHIGCPASQNSLDSHFLWFAFNHTGYFSFCRCWLLAWSLHNIWHISWMYIASNFRLITSFWKVFFFFLKETMSEHNCTFFSPSCLLFFLLNKCNGYTSSIVYFHFLAIFLSVDCLDHFVSVIVSHVDFHISYTFVWKSFIYLNVLLFTPYHLNVKKPASLLVWGCAGSVLWWETVL